MKRIKILSAYAPFLEHAIFLKGTIQIETTDIREYISNAFNIHIPIHTIKTLLKRLVRHGKIEQFSSYRYIQCKSITEEDIEQYVSILDDCQRSRNQLIDSFRSFTGLTLTDDEAIRLLNTYILDMLDQINLHSSFKTNGAKLSKVYFAITDFVNELRERNVQDYNTFKDIYYGSILSKQGNRI